LIDYDNLANIDDLKMAFLNEESMFMNKIPGFGIRSDTASLLSFILVSNTPKYAIFQNAAPRI
jgi:hypothetical protein